MATLSWLGYFTDEVTEVIVQLGEKPYTKKKATGSVADISSHRVSVGYENSSDKVVSRGDFFHELTKVLKDNAHWNQFFTPHGISFHMSHLGQRYRVMAVGYEGGTREKPTVVIRRA